jgi:heme/copper-type cytochrome/quinol oxidase subunit 3
MTCKGLALTPMNFFTVYYSMAFNHFLHVGWAVCAILWVILRFNDENLFCYISFDDYFNGFLLG